MNHYLLHPQMTLLPVQQKDHDELIRFPSQHIGPNTDDLGGVSEGFSFMWGGTITFAVRSDSRREAWRGCLCHSLFHTNLSLFLPLPHFHRSRKRKATMMKKTPPPPRCSKRQAAVSMKKSENKATAADDFHRPPVRKIARKKKPLEPSNEDNDPILPLHPTRTRIPCLLFSIPNQSKLLCLLSFCHLLTL